jgi:hypothetical protein
VKLDKLLKKQTKKKIMINPQQLKCKRKKLKKINNKTPANSKVKSLKFTSWIMPKDNIIEGKSEKIMKINLKKAQFYNDNLSSINKIK